MLNPKEKIELLQQIRELIMDGSQVPRLKGGEEGEVSTDVEIPTPESMMEAVEGTEEPMEDEDKDVKGVMLSMSRLAAKPIKKEDLKKKGKKVK